MIPVPTDLILYALIAAGLVFWLRSVLGTRHGEERERPNPFTQTQTPEKKVSANPLDDLAGEMGLETSEKPVLPRNVMIVSDAVQAGLDDIARVESGFDVVRFSQGAQDAFAMVVEAFGAGDRDTLQDLLEPQVYAAFDSAIVQREKDGHTMQTEIHAIRRLEFLDARIDDKKAYITVRFVADETCVVKDSAGQILSGNPERITEMNDIWVLSKPLKTRDPRWFVAETRDGDVKEQSRTPIPDSAH